MDIESKAIENKRMHSGYEIIQAIKITPRTEIVLGENLNKLATPYVVWTCFDGINYEWGHYYTNYMKALADFGTGVSAKAMENAERLAGMGCKDNSKPFFDREDCLSGSQQSEYSGRIVVVDIVHLAQECRHPSQQLYLATDGNGCNPNAKGQAVYATCLADGLRTHWERQHIIGVLDPEKTPAWARKGLARIHRLEKKEQEAAAPER